jgi:hypothetical protein
MTWKNRNFEQLLEKMDFFAKNPKRSFFDEFSNIQAICAGRRPPKTI